MLLMVAIGLIILVRPQSAIILGPVMLVLAGTAIRRLADEAAARAAGLPATCRQAALADSLTRRPTGRIDVMPPV